MDDREVRVSKGMYTLTVLRLVNIQNDSEALRSARMSLPEFRLNSTDLCYAAAVVCKLTNNR